MKARAFSGGGEGLWLRAEKQTGGKGRLGRKWESPEGNLYCSTLVAIRGSDPPASTLCFVTALAVFDTIRYFLPAVPMQLKWPNDILVSNAKLCGVLLERSGDMIIAGIGVNIVSAPEVMDRRTTSLMQEGTEKPVTAELFLDRLAKRFAERLIDWRTAGLPYVLQHWQSKAHPLNAGLSTTDENGDRIAGEYAGLAADGALRLRKPDGTLIEIHAGDVELDQQSAASEKG